MPGGGTWTLSQSGVQGTGFVENTASPDTTARNFWTLTNTSTTTAISSVDILGGLVLNGNVVFDRDTATGGGARSGGQIGTPGSDFGIDFVASTTSVIPPSPPPADSGPNSQYSVFGTYFNIVQLTGPNQGCSGALFSGNSTVTGCGDLWQGLTFAFNSPTAFIGGAGNPASFHFFQDTDQLGTPGTAPVPEPQTLGLMGVGLAAVFALRRYRYAR